ncbi:MAG: DNA polymerase III subunit delta [Candidatus Omnitrophica bacterium]|nr:DNA polymerase III subunit delta [Candidatus Omnitrophota bacterium]
MVSPAKKFEKDLTSAPSPKVGLSFCYSPKEKKKSHSSINLARVFLFSGEEEFLKEEAIEKLRKSYKPASGESNPAYNVFWAGDEGEFDIEKIIAVARTANLFSSNQIIVIKRIEELKSPELERLISYINNPTERTCLVLASGLNLRRKSGKSSEKESALELNCLKCPNLEITNFSYIADHEISLLVSSAGKSLMRLKFIMDQACLYAKDKLKLEARDMADFIGGEVQSDAYKILDAVLDRDVSRAVEILRKMSQFSVKPDTLIKTLAKELNKIYKAKKLIGQGLNVGEIQMKLGIKFYFDKFISSVHKIGMEELENKLKKLLYIDSCIKTGRLKPYFALESWIIGKLPL